MASNKVELNFCSGYTGVKRTSFPCGKAAFLLSCCSLLLSQLKRTRFACVILKKKKTLYIRNLGTWMHVTADSQSQPSSCITRSTSHFACRRSERGSGSCYCPPTLASVSLLKRRDESVARSQKKKENTRRAHAEGGAVAEAHGDRSETSEGIKSLMFAL